MALISYATVMYHLFATIGVLLNAMLNKIKESIYNTEYDFLRTDKHLGNNIIFLALGGSYAYGTNVETSDVDIRGCALNRESDIIGLTNFEQVIHTQTDTVVYSFNKLISLLINCNPNTIELLGCKPEHYLRMTPIGQEILNNKNLFLSKRAINSFGGYANQQLRRLQNSLARDNYPQEEKEKHMLNSIKSAVNSFNGRYKEIPQGALKIYLGQCDDSEMELEIVFDVNLKNYPLRDYTNMQAEMLKIVKDCGKINSRKFKKDNAHLNKHAMHLVRLYLMCFDILEKGEINTYRDKDKDLLLSIRNGYFQKEDGSFYKEFFDMIDDFTCRLERAGSGTALPDNPDMNKIEDFVMSVNKRVVINCV